MTSRLLAVALCLITALAAPGQPPAVKPQFDLIVLTDGHKVEGLIVDEQPTKIEVQSWTRRPGVRTVIEKSVFTRSEIANLVKAPEPGRSEARRMMAALASAETREREAARRLNLEQLPWVAGSEKSWFYRGPFFELQSNTDELFVRLVCARLNEIFASYVSNIGSRVQAPKPTRILLFRSLEEFRDWQLQRGIKLLNSAVYDPKSNEITVGCDLGRLARLRDELRSKHERQLQENLEQQRRLDEHYNHQPPAAQMRQLREFGAKLRQANLENRAAYERMEAGFFATLYHEAFHAYLDSVVFPAGQYEVPRWLNEGLAQLFENAFVEIGELRVGRIDEKRLQDIQDAIRRGRFMTLREILQAPPEQFFVRHTLEKFEADRQYDAAWALAHFLHFHLHILKPPATRLIEYVSKPPQAGQELKAFEKLVGMSLDECERKWRDYMLGLRVDGTVRRQGSE